MPQVGETLVFTLRFAMVQGCYSPAQARVSDPNPASLYLDVLTPTITGGAWYSPSIDGIVWEDMLIAGDEYEISYQVRVLGLPEQTPDTGYRITNTATIADLRKPGTLPLQSAHAVIQLGAPRALLPGCVGDRVPRFVDRQARGQFMARQVPLFDVHPPGGQAVA